MLEELQIEQEVDGCKIRTASSRENVILSRGGRECSGRREVREGFLEEVEFKNGHNLDRNAGIEILGPVCVLHS